MTQQNLLHNIDAEQALLGALLLDNELIDKINEDTDGTDSEEESEEELAQEA